MAMAQTFNQTLGSRFAAAPDAATRTGSVWLTRLIVFAPVVFATLLAKFTLPGLDIPSIGMLFPMVIVTVAAGLATGRLQPVPMRLALFLLMLSVLALIQVWRGELFSLPSLAMMAVLGFAYVPAIGTVQRWFVVKRGQASGWAVAGIGIGTMAAPPAAAYAIEVFDWRGAYVAFGVATLVLGILATALLRASPASMGLQPDGAAAPVTTAPSVPAGLELGQVLRSRIFWLLYLACGLNCIGTFVPFVHLAPYATDQGLSRTEGVWLVGLIGVGSTLGRFVLGGLADRIGRDRSLALIMLLNGVALAYWSVAQGFVALAIFALVFGLFYGGFVALVPAFTADLFGLRAMSAVLGVLYTSVAFGTLLGPTLAGWVFDSTGSYTWPILICAGGCAVSALMVWKLQRS